MKLFIHKLTHWEYWPFQVLYIPIYFLWIYYALRSRSLFFFNAVNPTIKNGGFFNESKNEIYKLIPQKYYPKTHLINHKESIDNLNNHTLSFPFIVKPDIGLRGSAVKRIYSLDELKHYHKNVQFNYLIQELIPFSNEIGIFYVRFPNEKQGRITGIVSKEFMIIKGDGKNSIEKLIKQDPRYELQLNTLKKELGSKIQDILPKGEVYNLVPFGNHCRGTKFLDISHKISEKLTKVIDTMCQQIDGFYYGRMDLMYNTWDELENGKNFMIVELNGSASEPTHIYDPNHSIFFAWKEIARHITYMYQISQENHTKGIAYLNYKEGMSEYRKHQEHFYRLTQV
ncbi:ATP-grasp domain-containing protein [Flavobacterium oreochromis]|uniref:D-alanine--D-alanine ligase n=2 Tax=Flavobacterium TaxID=237 RepID=A0A246G9I7_9FLAO|nr:D-alanine--D-alanine ligase [Flavobacterium oreochromis]OWP76240.1 D-alanine--D-alanine ligase [Flavobacterium oreochromis]OWP76908.1 D-alanine--D-alanine ligase [Flavobacterium oreochromis]POR18328.1 D-alanine--D-alanine ligase [Flavobacterium columnare]QYS86039.1 D-alanine--D-alanine ligase [Flavobacterium oreochromis]